MKSELIDLTGQKFGKITIIKQVKKPEHIKYTKSTYWLYRCDCGIERIINGYKLRRFKLKKGFDLSCGCDRKEKSFIKRKAYLENHREERREYQKKYQEKYQETHDRKQYFSHYFKKYGMTKEEYIQFFNNQNGKCKICGKHQSELKRRLAVDHCHITGRIRGLICANCNTAIGFFNDDPVLVGKAKIYLENC